ncbi:MAG: Sua5 YciO YrdC YwlC family protein [Campylobacterales bacterium]
MNEVVLAQTDTTVGFLSQDAARLALIKGRPQHKPFLRVVATLEVLKEFVRVPPNHRARVRRATKTTFIYPQGEAIRVVHGSHASLVARWGWLYSTSANQSGKLFDEAWARSQADVIVEEPKGFVDAPSSRLIRLGRARLRRMR